MKATSTQLTEVYLVTHVTRASVLFSYLTVGSGVSPSLDYDVWFQNRRAKFRKQERLAQQKTTNGSSENSSPQTNSIKAENSSNAKIGNSLNSSKEIKPGSPHSGMSTTPNSNASSISSQNSTNGIDIKPVNGTSKLTEDIISNNNKWSSMTSQSCNTALLVHQANKVLSSQSGHHLQSHHGHHHAAAAAAAALTSPFTSLLGAGGGAASYLLGDHLKHSPTPNHLF
ncbi:hypothetical protein WA026_009765 [Henosepilachna vigintioctopunctata]|uniref:Homeobox domain-containing protein n=1 Tax=Henosepilachna vigintioctopunctata TaxID=420089 RepID=A0AAW1TJ03_9CUCU